MKLEDELKQTKFKNEQNKLFLNIMFTSNWLNTKQLRFFRRYDLSPQQYNILRILKGQYPDRIKVMQVQERMLDRLSNASRLIEKLVVNGLVSRKTGEVDRREAYVAITDVGLKLLDEISTKIAEIDNIFKGVSIADSKKFNELLDALRV